MRAIYAALLVLRNLELRKSGCFKIVCLANFYAAVILFNEIHLAVACFQLIELPHCLRTLPVIFSFDFVMSSVCV